jgi:hypothetical protein
MNSVFYFDVMMKEKWTVEVYDSVSFNARKQTMRDTDFAEARRKLFHGRV